MKVGAGIEGIRPSPLGSDECLTSRISFFICRGITYMELSALSSVSLYGGSENLSLSLRP